MNEFGSLLRNRQNFISKTRINKCFFSSNNDDSSKPLNEAQKRRRWLDVSIVLKNSGRAFDADKELVPISSAVTFPNLKCTDLHGRDKIFPNDWSAQVKLVTLSFKESGGTMLAGWSDPFREHFSSSSSSVSTSPSQTSTAVQLMMVEYAMLSVAKSWFIKGATTTIPAANHANTCFVFGGVKPFAERLDVPNLFSGYAYLLDSQNRVRWRASGIPRPSDIELMIQHAVTLSKKRS